MSPEVDRTYLRLWGATAGIVAAPLFLAILVLLDIVDRRIDLSGHELGRLGPIMNANFFLFGALALWFALTMRTLMRNGKAAIAATVALVLFAFGPLLATFTLDLQNGGPPTSWHGTLHFIGFMLIALTFLPAALLFALAFRGDRRWRGLELVSAIVGIALVAIVFAPIPATQPYPLWTGPASMLELFLIGAWMVGVAMRARTIVRESDPRRQLRGR